MEDNEIKFNVNALKECTAKIRLFRMSAKWKGETEVDVAEADEKDGGISRLSETFKSKSWKDDCLIISLDICDGEFEGERILLWPLSDDDATAPGVMNLYLCKDDVNVKFSPKFFPVYKL